MGGTAILSLVLFGAVMVALNPPDFRGGQQAQELYNTDRKPVADGLAGLPSTYDAIPKLGPPFPAILGTPCTRLIPMRHRNCRLATSRFSPTPKPTLPVLTAFVWHDLASRGASRSCFIPLRQHERQMRPQKRKRVPHKQRLRLLRPLGNLMRRKVKDSRTPDSAGQEVRLPECQAGWSIYNEHSLQKPMSPFTLMAGSIIPASLVTGLNSDLPGFVIGQVTENVYDTVTGRYLLVPQGTKIIGKYDSVVAFGQKRALVVWQRLIRPDGSSIGHRQSARHR